MALVLLLPACAQAAQIVMAMEEDEVGGSRLAVFSAAADAIDTVPGQETQPDAVMLAIDAQIEARFAQHKAQTAIKRGTVVQTGSVWQDGKTASMALTWRGEQADGSEGCASMGLTVDLATGEEILLPQLLTNWDGALSAMETIVTDDVLDGMSDYMEYSDLLPMPTDSYSFGDFGLTVYWPEDRYRYFDGTSGSVTFYWHELAEFIGEESPVYELSRPQSAVPEMLRTVCGTGTLGDGIDVTLGQLLGTVAYRLADPDYTTDALVYPLERMRGYAIEIPKFAETEDEDTPVSAIRASRISLHGLMTGKTARAEIIALLGEPVGTSAYDEDAALDAMLEPGESLFYDMQEHALQLHLDRDGVLSCIILRSAMPESLY